ncbi:MAG: copper-binding protein [Candidatus Rokuibacteriota bacterium]
MTAIGSRLRLAALVAWLAAPALAAPIAAQPAARLTAPARVDYRGTGVVLALLPPPSTLHATRPVMVIDHDAIKGLMEERMSMPFIAASTALFAGLEAGDRIAFGLMDTPDALLVVTVERLAHPR